MRRTTWLKQQTVSDGDWSNEIEDEHLNSEYNVWKNAAPAMSSTSSSHQGVSIEGEAETILVLIK